MDRHRRYRGKVMKFVNYLVESTISSMDINNLGMYMDALKLVVMTRKTHDIINIGDESLYIPLIVPMYSDKSKKNILVCSGFHGNENSGPWSVLEYYKENSEFPVNLSMLPIVNPTGFKQDKRTGRYGVSTDTFNTHSDVLSIESNVLIDNIKFFLKRGKDGIINLHEDTKEKFDGNAYVYASDDLPDYITNYILSTLNDHFEILHSVDGKIEDKVIQGVVSKLQKGSWEELLNKKGIPMITTEFSSREPIDKRVKVGVELITGFVELIS